MDEELQKLPVDLLQRGKYQPRIDLRQETLQELADSIKAQGVVQPIIVRPIGAATGDNGATPSNSGFEQRYEIIAGERRWRAAQLAGLHEIPAVIRRVPDEAAIAMALIENIQRENLNPLEEARALQRLITEFEMTHATAAEAVGRSRAAVSNLLRLLERQQVSIRDVDLFAVASGPGSFTGLRIGVGRDAAASFSFLLSIPAIGGAVILEGRKDQLYRDLQKEMEQLAQTRQYAERFVALGCRPDGVKVVSSLKYDTAEIADTLLAAAPSDSTLLIPVTKPIAPPTQRTTCCMIPQW